MRQLTQIDAPQGGALVNSICTGYLCGVPHFRLIGCMVSDIMTVSVNQVKRQEGEKMTSQTVGAVSEQDMVLNRQINFLIMRKMWQDIRGRAKRGEAGKETIYHAFGMSRERYTRAINGEPVRFSQKELRDLMLKTGVNSDIFQGVTCFHFEAITRKDWEKLFVLRGEDIQRARTFERNLYQQITKKDLDMVTNPNLYRLTVYLRTSAPVTDFQLEETIREQMNWMDKNGIASLERCDPELLGDYLDALEKHIDMVRTLTHYRELKGKK